MGPSLCENAKTLDQDRTSYSFKTALAADTASLFNFEIEPENIILVALRVFEFSHRLGQNRTFVAGFLAITSPLSCLTPQAPAFSLDGFRGIADMIASPPGTTSGVARIVLADCLFRTHVHVLVWSIQYWPSVRYCGMNCPTDSTMISRL